MSVHCRWDDITEFGKLVPNTCSQDRASERSLFSCRPSAESFTFPLSPSGILLDAFLPSFFFQPCSSSLEHMKITFLTPHRARLTFSKAYPTLPANPPKLPPAEDGCALGSGLPNSFFISFVFDQYFIRH